MGWRGAPGGRGAAALGSRMNLLGPQAQGTTAGHQPARRALLDQQPQAHEPHLDVGAIARADEQGRVVSPVAILGRAFRDGVIGNTRHSGCRLWGSSPCPGASVDVLPFVPWRSARLIRSRASGSRSSPRAPRGCGLGGLPVRLGSRWCGDRGAGRVISVAWMVAGAVYVVGAVLLGSLDHMSPLEFWATIYAVFLPPLLTIGALTLGRRTPSRMVYRVVLDRAPPPPEGRARSRHDGPDAAR